MEVAFDLPISSKKYLILRLPGYRHKPLQLKITLVEGHLSNNPGGATYSRCTRCHKGSRITGTHVFFEPELVTVHHSEPALSLWFCLGCPNILIRLDGEKRECKHRKRMRQMRANPQTLMNAKCARAT